MAATASVPTTAPVKLRRPPTTSIAKVRKVMLSQKILTASVPRKCPNRMPPMAKKNALITNAIRRSLQTTIPAARAATSSSRAARRRKPWADDMYIWAATIVTATHPRAAQRSTYSGRPTNELWPAVMLLQFS